MTRWLEGLLVGFAYGYVPHWLWRKWQCEDEQLRRMDEQLRKATR